MESKKQIEIALECFENGEVGDVSDAISTLINFAMRGDVTAQFYLGEIYWNGIGVPINDEQAIYWYTLAGENGHPLVQLWLGNNYFIGIRSPIDYSKAFYWYNKAALNNIVLAQYHLGVCYSLGLGVPKSDQSAFYWMHIASDRNYLEAMLYVADAYRRGIGTDVDCLKANELQDKIVREYYSKAFEDYNIAIKLAIAFEQGRGVDKNLCKAFEILSNPRFSDVEEVQCMLAECHEKGYGVPQDPYKAKQIYEGLCNPSPKAKSRLKLLCMLYDL